MANNGKQRTDSLGMPIVSKKPLTSGYKPSMPRVWFQTPRDLPLFTFLTIESMLIDPTITLGLAMRAAPIISAEIAYKEGDNWIPGVKADNPKVAAFVERQVNRFWKHDLQKVLKSQVWGWSAGEIIYKVDTEQSLIEYESIRSRDSRDVEPLEKGGVFTGVRFNNIGNHGHNIGRGSIDIGYGKSFWHSFNPEGDSYYGTSVLKGAYSAFADKWFDGGALDVRRLYMHADAYSGKKIGYPPGSTNIDGLGDIPNRDIALQIVEQSKAGDVAVFPVVYDESGNKLWIVEDSKISGNADSILNYPKDIDAEILRGMEIPDDVLMSQMTGSWQGKQVPMQAFYTGLNIYAYGVLAMATKMIFEPLVFWNFGSGEDFEITIKPLDIQAMEQQKPQEQGQEQQEAPGGFDSPGVPVQGPPQTLGLEKVGDGSVKAIDLVNSVKQVIRDIPETHEFSSTQLQMPRFIIPKLFAMASSIPRDKLVEIETDPHITVKFGIHDNDDFNVRNLMDGEGPVTASLGRTNYFPGDEHDTIYVEVHSDDIHRLNQSITRGTRNTETNGSYVPHVTLARVKSGEGRNYIGLDNVEGTELAFSELMFSNKRREKIPIGLTGMVQLAQAPKGGVTIEGKFFLGGRFIPGRSQAEVDKAAKKTKEPKQVDKPKKSIKNQTKTPEFKKWFGGSKVVDESGEPLVVLHVTSEEFTEFDPEKAAMGGIFWFTASKSAIEANETGAGLRPGKEKRVIEVFLSIQKMAGWDEYEKMGIGELKSAGFDGIKLDDDYVVFSPTQIKSSTTNKGTFDPDNPNITLGLIRMTAQAPKGGVTIEGTFFPGGEFIPGRSQKEVDKAAKETKEPKQVDKPKKSIKNQTSTPEFKVSEPSNFIDPEKIEPINEITDTDKFERLVTDLKSSPWNGPPVLVFNTTQGFEAITGSHRILAAREAEIKLPVFELEPDDLEVELSDGSKLGEMFFEVDDEDKHRLLRDAAELNPDNDSIKTALKIMEFEVDQNLESGRNPNITMGLIRMTAQSPKGGVEIEGQFFPGGEFIPGRSQEEVDKAADKTPQGKPQKKTALVSVKRTKDGQLVLSDGSPLPEHLKGIRPDLTNVKVNLDPNAARLATGIDSKGRKQSMYSAAHSQMRSAMKFNKIMELATKFEAVTKQNRGNFGSGKKGEAALVMAMIMRTGMRPGSLKDQKSEKQAFGAVTLLGKHVKVKNGNVTLEFTGKKGVPRQVTITDETIASELIKRKAGDNDRLFSISSANLRKYSSMLDGGSFTPKDFRTHKGTSIAAVEVAKIKAPETEKEYKSIVKSIATKVSKVLGNTPAIALQSYINPTVFSKLRSA